MKIRTTDCFFGFGRIQGSWRSCVLLNKQNQMERWYIIFYNIYIYCTYICIHTIHVIVIYVYIYTDMFAAADRASIAFFGLEHLAYKKLAQHFLSARPTCWITRPSVGPAVSGVVDKADGSWKSMHWCQTDESFVGAISRVSRVSPRMIILLVWELISSWREHFQLHPEKCSNLGKNFFFELRFLGLGLCWQCI